MKKLLVIVMLLMSGFVKAQDKTPFFKSFNNVTGYASLVQGFGAEVSKPATFEPVKKMTYAYGVGIDLGTAAEDENVDISVYVKGLYPIYKNLDVVGQLGMRDLINPGAGIGIRYTVKGEALNFVIEPLIHTDGSRLNLGLQFPLKK